MQEETENYTGPYLTKALTQMNETLKQLVAKVEELEKRVEALESN